MLKEAEIPTPLTRPEDREEIPIAPSTGRVRFRVLQVLLAFARWFAGNLGLVLLRRYDERTAGRRLRELFEELGFLWIKMGQLLATRADLLSPEVCDELARLQYRAIGFPPEDARRTIEAELGGPVERFFVEFEDRPCAAASICQVHRARLRDSGMLVAVKVQRPGILRTFQRDMFLLRLIMGMLPRLNIMSYMRWGEMVWELEQVMVEEIDYRYEASNLSRVRRNLKRYRKTIIPKVLIDHCTSRLLVMEYLDGVLMSEYIHANETDPHRLNDWLKENGIDPKKVGRRLFMTFFRQLAEDNLFHADLHPGNIMLLRDNRIALIDLGSVGSLESETLKRYLLMIRSIASHEYSKAADLALLMCPDLPVIDTGPVKELMIRVFRSWDARTHLKNLSYAEKSFGDLGAKLAKVMVEHRIVGDWASLKISRSWTTMDASLTVLIPDVNYTKLFQRYFEKTKTRGGAARIRGLRKSVESVSLTVAEFGLLLGPIVRRQAQVFQGAAGKLARAMSVFFRGVSWVVLIGMFALLWNLLHSHHYEHVDALDSGLLGAVADWIPNHEYEIAIALVLMAYLIYRFMRKLERTCRETDVRLP